MIGYIVLVSGFIFGVLTLHASMQAKKNDAKHQNTIGLYAHLASTFSMYALTVWGVLELMWWSPFVVFIILFQLFRFVVTSSNWQKFFRVIPITGSLITAITCGAWITRAIAS